MNEKEARNLGRRYEKQKLVGKIKELIENEQWEKMTKKQIQAMVDNVEGAREINEEFGRGGEWVEAVRYELVKRACRRQEKANLNFKSESLPWSSILDCVFGKFCEELRLEEQTVLMRKGWREFIKTL